MALELKNVEKRVGAETHIHPTSLKLEQGSFNILLGTTLAGKTTLMQLMAGIQKPTSGEIWFKGKNITSTAVQKRNVSFVYQQFINYPNLTVYDNIASPLHVAGMAKAEIERRVKMAADLLRLTPMLQRRPSELSGGQQQRTAIARAVVKDSDLIFMDEPLANLDYKLREELRGELPKLFAGRDSIVIYATTEPSEALLFGGSTATLHEGRVTHFGLTSEIYRKPRDLVSAQVFSDPPINAIGAVKKGKSFTLPDGVKWPAGRFSASLQDGDYIIGIRPHHIGPSEKAGASGAINGSILVTELSGSESIIHMRVGEKTWVSQAEGIHEYAVGDKARLYADIDRALIFKSSGEFVA